MYVYVYLKIYIYIYIFIKDISFFILVIDNLQDIRSI